MMSAWYFNYSINVLLQIKKKKNVYVYKKKERNKTSKIDANKIRRNNTVYKS